MIISQNSNFENGDYLLVGIPQDTNDIDTVDISLTSGTITGRWKRVWWADLTDAGNTLSVDVSFDYQDAGNMGYPKGLAACYSLIHRTGSSGSWTPIAFATSISGDRVNFTNVVFPNDGYYTLATCHLFVNPLPIELLSFEASLLGENTVQLNWATASESETNYFEIEKSRDAQSWTTVGITNAAGTSSTIRNYSMLDDKPLNGISYYRLKQVDLNGTWEYSDIRSVNFEGLELIKAFPNPASNEINLLINSKIETPSQLDILNITGQQVFKASFTIERGYSIENFKLPLLSAGSYILKVTSNNGVYINQIQIK